MKSECLIHSPTRQKKKKKAQLKKNIIYKVSKLWGYTFYDYSFGISEKLNYRKINQIRIEIRFNGFKKLRNFRVMGLFQLDSGGG